MGAFSLAGLTACGDKVNVQGVQVDSAVTAVTVSPPSANLNVGDKITLVATVTAGAAQTNRNVTWSTSNAAVATVDATSGLVTAVGGGTTTIIATSSANSAIKGAAAITVGAVVQPTVTISTINQTVAGTGSVPADLSNVAKQLDVTINVDPGTQKLAKVDLIMNCGKDTVVATQTVAAGDVAPLSADESTAPVTLSFNTAAFNSTTGAVAFKNGACTLKADAVTTTGTIVASNGTPLTLNNANTVVATFATTPSTGQVASATDANGLLWRAGAVTVTAIPVIYTANVTIATAAVSLMNAGNDIAIGRSGSTVALVAGNTAIATQSGLVPASGVVTATFANSTTSPGVGGAVVDTLGVQVTTVDSNGNPGPTLNASTLNFIRLDNRAPDIATTAPAWNANQENTLNGWIGAAFVFKTAATTTAGVPITLGSAAVDNQTVITANSPNSTGGGGVDKVTTITQWSPAGAGTWTTFTSPTSLAETSASTAYDLRIMICDALGNCSTSATLTTFGIDLTPPSLSEIAGPTNNKVYAIGTASPSAVTFGLVDTSNTAGVSGSGPGPTGVLVSVQGLQPDSNSATGSRTRCPIGTTTGSGLAITCKAQVAEPLSFALPGTLNGNNAQSDGEYTMTANAVDQAGNQSATLAIKWYNDHDAPAVTGGVSIPNPINATSSFSLSASDSMDVAAGNGFLRYPGAGVQFFETGSASPVGATFDNVLARSSSVSVTLATFYRSLAAATGGVVPGSAGGLPDVAGIRAIDAAGNLSANTPVSLPAANLGAAGTISNSSATNGITSFQIDSVVKNPSDAGAAVTIFADAQAFSPTGGTPFSQVCFYFVSPTGLEGGKAGLSGSAAGELLKIGCTTSIVTTGDGVTTRFFQFSTSWTPPSVFFGSSATIVAVGNSSAGDALITDGFTLNVNALP